MVVQPESATNQGSDTRAGGPRQARSGIIGGVVKLAAGGVFLLCIMLLYRDAVHRKRAMDIAGGLARTIDARASAAGILPLNLRPDVPQARAWGGYRLEWLSSNDARCLRTVDGPVIVARTVPRPLLFRADGRAVVVFEGDRCRVEWMALGDYDRRNKLQDAQIVRCAQDRERQSLRLP